MAQDRGYKGFRDLKVYKLAYKLAMEIFGETKHFPIEERYELTNQEVISLGRC